MGIGEGVFGFNNFFKVGPETNTLIHVALDLELCLVSPGVFNIPFQKFDLVTLNLQFQVLVTNFPFQIYDKVVGVGLTSTTEFEASVLRVLLEL